MLKRGFVKFVSDGTKFRSGTRYDVVMWDGSVLDIWDSQTLASLCRRSVECHLAVELAVRPDGTITHGQYLREGEEVT